LSGPSPRPRSTSARAISTYASPTAASSPTATEVESGGEVKMTKQEIIEMIQRSGFDPVERDTVYNRVAAV